MSAVADVPDKARDAAWGRRARTAVTLAGLALWVLGIDRIVESGAARDWYRERYSNEPPPYPYDAHGVREYFALMTAEMLALVVLIRPWSLRRESWRRTLLAASSATLFVAPFVVFLMHAPPTTVTFTFWSVGVAKFCWVLAAATCVASLAEWFRRTPRADPAAASDSEPPPRDI